VIATTVPLEPSSRSSNAARVPEAWEPFEPDLQAREQLAEIPGRAVPLPAVLGRHVLAVIHREAQADRGAHCPY